jgi:hypothetical protein
VPATFSLICRFCIFAVRNVAYAQAARCPLGIASTRKLACWEEKMLLPFSTVVLASQLIISVADNVPKFDIERGCKVDSTASSLDTGLDESIKRCVDDEQQAQDQLQMQWSQFAPSDRVMCTSETTEGGGVPPSYVELLTCLQGQQLAKRMNK